MASVFVVLFDEVGGTGWYRRRRRAEYSIFRSWAPLAVALPSLVHVALYGLSAAAAEALCLDLILGEVPDARSLRSGVWTLSCSLVCRLS